MNWKRFAKWTGLTVLTSVTALGLAGTYFYYSNTRDLPKPNPSFLKNYETSKITDKDGNIIWQSTETRIDTTTYKELKPTLLDDGLIAVEDKTFWKNSGVDWLGTAIGVANGRGGSTIDQQLIKNKFFNGGNNISTIKRKFQEWFLALQLNQNFSKKEILELYVNNLSYAEGDTGLAAIAKTYFNKNMSDYTERSIENIAQQAYLIGLGQNPTAYNLYEHPEAAKKRMKVVLGVMKKAKIITASEYKEAKNYDLTSTLQPRYWESEQQVAQNKKYKTYTDNVLKEIATMGYNIEDVTLNIKTFLDQATYDNITNTVRDNQYYLDENEQIGATVIDKDGIVVGMVGGRSDDDELNRAIQTTRSSGSSMKPFTAYGPLYQYFGDLYSTASIFSSAPYLYPGTSVYMNNYGNYTYGNVTAMYALRMSLNTPVARIDDELLGSNRIKTFLANVGLDVKDSYSSVDGIGIDISSLQAAAAYNAINNGGVYTEPRFVDTITFTDGSVKTVKAKHRQAMNPSVAYVLSQMLRGVPQANYTATAAAIPNWEGYAGKTGSVALDSSSGAYNLYGNGGSDVWYDSFTNGGYSISIWMGYDQPNTSPQVADDFKGHQKLGKDLQLMLNNNASSIANWTRPDTVSVISGAGLDTNYAVTDSKDNTSNNIVTTTVNSISSNLSILESITKAKETEKADSNWKTKAQTDDDYTLFKSYPSLSDTTVINKSLYDKLSR